MLQALSDECNTNVTSRATTHDPYSGDLMTELAPGRMPGPDAAAIVERVLADENLAPRDFEHLADTSRQTLYRWAKGKANPYERDVARAVADMGADPEKYGLRPPRTAGNDATTQPDWAIRLEQKLDEHAAAQAEMLRILKRLDDR